MGKITVNSIEIDITIECEECLNNEEYKLKFESVDDNAMCVCGICENETSYSLLD